MKIKFKQTRVLKIANITFSCNNSKANLSKIKSNTTQTNVSISRLKNPGYFCYDDPNIDPNINQDDKFELQKNCLLLKYTSFIPKNPNVKSVLFFSQRQNKPIQSLESAKQLQKRFPIGKILTRRSIIGFSNRKDKIFQFSNPETQQQLFKNKKITNSMIKSQSLFYSANQFNQGSKIHNQKKRNSTTFHRYEIADSSLANSTTSLSFRVKEASSIKHRAITKLSNANI